jgi:hypothetical protein
LRGDADFARVEGGAYAVFLDNQPAVVGNIYRFGAMCDTVFYIGDGAAETKVQGFVCFDIRIIFAAG